ncbi:hypothetical protein D9M72_334300 [compost metagenome]
MVYLNWASGTGQGNGDKKGGGFYGIAEDPASRPPAESPTESRSSQQTEVAVRGAGPALGLKNKDNSTPAQGLLLRAHARYGLLIDFTSCSNCVVKSRFQSDFRMST